MQFVFGLGRSFFEGEKKGKSQFVFFLLPLFPFPLPPSDEWWDGAIPDSWNKGGSSRAAAAAAASSQLEATTNASLDPRSEAGRHDDFALLVTWNLERIIHLWFFFGNHAQAPSDFHIYYTQVIDSSRATFALKYDIHNKCNIWIKCDTYIQQAVPVSTLKLSPDSLRTNSEIQI